MVEIVDKIKTYILDFCAYDLEPLHLLLSALIDSQLCTKASRAIPTIIELVEDGSLECYHHSTKGGDEYKKVDNLQEVNLLEYVSLHEKQNFKEYPIPEEGGEYFFRTTEAGYTLINNHPLLPRGKTDSLQEGQ